MAAYNPYYPTAYTGYQPYYQTYQPVYQPSVVQQPIQTQIQQQTVPTIQQTGIIWVMNESEAMAYPVAPNNAVTLWNQNEPVVYVKQTDASGKPSTKTYDLVERSQSASESAVRKDVKTVDYATKDDLAAIVGAVNGFGEAISNIKADVDGLKGDMYGLSGKRKTVKKTEVEPDE